MSDVDIEAIRGVPVVSPMKRKTIGDDLDGILGGKKSQEEDELEDIVFEGAIRRDEVDSEEEEVEQIKRLKSCWDSEDEGDSPRKDSEEEEVDDDAKDEDEKKKPVWVDDEDEIVPEDPSALGVEKTLGEKLREHHEKIYTKPSWATKTKHKSSADDEDDEASVLLTKASRYIERKPGEPLPSHHLSFNKCTQMNKFCFQKSPVSSLQFHPTSEIAMVAHKNGIVSFLSVDSKECKKIQNVQFKDFDLSCARLSPDGMTMYCGSNKYRTLQCYDLLSGGRSQVKFPKAHELTNMKCFEISPDGTYIAVYGRFGNIYILDGDTKQEVCKLKMNEELKCLQFTQDNLLFSHGGTYVYLWDIPSRKCVHKFLDDGCLQGISMCLSPNGKLLATGCDSGIVNIYDASKLRKESQRTPQPEKCIKNLITPASCCQFNSTSEILFIGSRFKHESLKMVHVPSLSVFPNFPNPRFPMYSTAAAAFSPNSGYLAIGTTLGVAHLLRLNHYSSY